MFIKSKSQPNITFFRKKWVLQKVISIPRFAKSLIPSKYLVNWAFLTKVARKKGVWKCSSSKFKGCYRSTTETSHYECVINRENMKMVGLIHSYWSSVDLHPHVDAKVQNSVGERAPPLLKEQRNNAPSRLVSPWKIYLSPAS